MPHSEPKPDRGSVLRRAMIARNETTSPIAQTATIRIAREVPSAPPAMTRKASLLPANTRFRTSCRLPRRRLTIIWSPTTPAAVRAAAAANSRAKGSSSTSGSYSAENWGITPTKTMPSVPPMAIAMSIAVVMSWIRRPE